MNYCSTESGKAGSKTWPQRQADPTHALKPAPVIAGNDHAPL